jgi:class 3 adenylate cyclase
MFTDIAGFSRQMGSDEARMLRLLEAHDQIIRRVVTAHHGHVIKTMGDVFLVAFPSVVHAVQCAPGDPEDSTLLERYIAALRKAGLKSMKNRKIG